MMVRAATSERAAKSFAETFDQAYIDYYKFLGITAFTSRMFLVGPGIEKMAIAERSSTVSILSECPGGSDEFIKIDSTITDSDSNKSCDEDAYQSKVSYREFETYDYNEFSTSSVIIDGSFADLKDELDTAEDENEYEEYGNHLVGAGFDDTAAAMEEVMKSRIAVEYSIPVGSITITNYTVSDVWTEMELAESIADQVRDEYDDSQNAALYGTAGAWDNFKKKCSLKLGRMQIGKKLNAWKQTIAAKKATAQSCEKTRGLTKVFQKLALGDKLKTGWNKFKNSTKTVLTKVTTGTTKFLKKPFSIMGSFFKKYFRYLIFVAVGLITILILIVVLNKGNFGVKLKGNIPGT